MKETFPIMGKTYKGLEEVLAKELQDMGAQDIEVGNRAVSFKGDKSLLYKVNLCARTATRFLVPLVTFEARDADELYAKAKAIDWSEYLSADNTFSIDSTVYSETFTHSKFVAYRVKDAIADQFMEKEDKRPSVSLTNADLMINVHVSETVCTISLDSTGESLHKRGYRVGQTEAPISEVLAAGMLLQAGWDGSTDLIDPMCGSGTIVIEAALIALNIPPGIFRKEFAFEKWRDFDKELFDELYNDDSFEREFNHKIYGSDISVPAIRIAEQNVKSAGLTKYIELNAVSIQDIEMPETAKLMVTNPPYGERLKPEKIQDLYGDIGRMLKQKFTGGTAWVISSEETYLSCIGMKPSQKIHLMNGEMDCLYCKYEVFAGKREDFVKEKIRNGEYHKEEEKPEFKRTERGHFSLMISRESAMVMASVASTADAVSTATVHKTETMAKIEAIEEMIGGTTGGTMVSVHAEAEKNSLATSGISARTLSSAGIESRLASSEIRRNLREASKRTDGKTVTEKNAVTEGSSETTTERASRLVVAKASRSAERALSGRRAAATTSRSVMKEDVRIPGATKKINRI